MGFILISCYYFRKTGWSAIKIEMDGKFCQKRSLILPSIRNLRVLTTSALKIMLQYLVCCFLFSYSEHSDRQRVMEKVTRTKWVRLIDRWVRDAHVGLIWVTLNHRDTVNNKFNEGLFTVRKLVCFSYVVLIIKSIFWSIVVSFGPVFDIRF